MGYKYSDRLGELMELLRRGIFILPRRDRGNWRRVFRLQKFAAGAKWNVISDLSPAWYSR